MILGFIWFECKMAAAQVLQLQCEEWLKQVSMMTPHDKLMTASLGHTPFLGIEDKAMRPLGTRRGKTP